MFCKIATAALMLAAVAAPAQARDKNKVAADGYRIERVDFVRTQPNIEFKFFKTKAEFFEAARALKSPARENDGDELADVVVVRRSGSCTIYMIDPQVQYDPTYMGHAVTHCVLGPNFHGPNDIGPRMQTAGM